MKTDILIDTCVAIWLVDRLRFDAAAESEVLAAAQANRLWLSPFTAWEVAMLVRKNKIRLNTTARQWFESLRREQALNLAPLTAEILAESQTLPEPFHNDPADRIIVATARTMNATLVTRDRLIEAYAALGHVRVLPC